MSEHNSLIVGMIKSLKEDNSVAHAEIKNRLDITNGNITRIKTSQIYLRGILIGVGVILLALGLIPERLFQIIKMAF